MLDEPRLAFSFLSRLPFGGKGNVKHIARYFTLVGYVAGLLYWADAGSSRAIWVQS